MSGEEPQIEFSPLSPMERAWRDYILGISVNASDVYLYSDGRVVVRERRQNVLVELPEPLRGFVAFKGFFDCFLGRNEYERLHKQKEGCDYSVSMGKVRFRVSTGLNNNGEDITMRRIRGDIPDLEFIKAPNSLVKLCCEMESGLIIVAGATGKGKSSLLAGLIQERANTRGGQIDSLEDPIEFLFKDNPSVGAFFRQRELYRDFMSFDGALKDELRRALDVLLVQEIRDVNVLKMAIQAALSGHIVFASYHAENSRTAVARCCDMLSTQGSNESLAGFSDALRAVVAIDLLPIPEEMGGGMTPIHEILINDPRKIGAAIGNHIRSKKFDLLDAEIDIGRTHGMQTFELSKKKRVEEGLLPRSVLRNPNA